jgi:hypothetical protein
MRPEAATAGSKMARPRLFEGVFTTPDDAIRARSSGVRILRDSSFVDWFGDQSIPALARRF